MFLISKENPFLYVLFFKTILPVFFGNFYAFSFFKWSVIKLGLANTESNQTVSSESDKKRN